MHDAPHAGLGGRTGAPLRGISSEAGRITSSRKGTPEIQVTNVTTCRHLHSKVLTGRFECVNQGRHVIARRSQRRRFLQKRHLDVLGKVCSPCFSRLLVRRNDAGNLTPPASQQAVDLDTMIPTCKKYGNRRM